LTYKTDGIEPLIIQVIAMRLSEQEALSYLSERGYPISRSELYRIKQEIKDSSRERLNLIASDEFLSQHIERIDTLRSIESELWIQYRNETMPSRKANILMQIVEVQTVLASFYDSSQYVLQQSAMIKKRRRQEQEIEQ